MSDQDSAINFKRIILGSLSLTLTGVILGICLIIYFSQNLPSIEQLENYDPDLVTQIISADGIILNELFVMKRVFVGLDKIPKNIQEAVIASEDKRFYTHWGLSLRSVMRAIMVNISSLNPYAQGFSTLTQQLARNLYKSVGFEDSYIRKIKEIITAIQIERTYTKDEILEMYLNTVHFGHGTYGVEAATKRFFGKISSK